MVTTAIFAELIVVGLQVQAWAALLLMGVFGTDWVKLTALEKWAALLTILVLALAYMFGVIFDRIANDVYVRFYRLARGRRKRPDGERTESPGPPYTREKRLAVIDASEGLAKFLDYQRSRLRVARATSVNTLLAVPCTAVFLGAHTDPSGTLIVFLIMTAVVLVVGATYTAIAVNRAWEDSLEAAYGIVQATRSDNTATT
ncbi:hypothetical protein OJ997_29745 [Solirubrobacter phytolaccae]|uniref:Uncharacterized protein n=1 Tax=Solirubrobacter phytolaccae TaxID=1404360 RepID=A0A9X3NDM0_9ACTN|nr:hypothetical protein [Solirubrobacter phytolaccae]MDA0184523.1 hypothetical protein [Solirubrobacter phytolaccae]